jgi:inorganic pyrophosphatase
LRGCPALLSENRRRRTVNIWHDISPERISAEDFYAVVEIQKGSKTKYELDKDTGMLVLDRILSTSTHYPANYGFIPRTYGDDNDPLDVLILCSEPIVPMTLVRCYPIGMFTMIDNGRMDSKIIAIPFTDPSYNGYRDVSELPKHISLEMTHFFSVYKELEQTETEVAEVEGREKAIAAIKKEIENYIAKFG